MPPFLTPRHRALGVGILVALLAAAAVALAVGGCAGKSSVAPAQVQPRTRPLETIFEAQAELFANPGPTLDLLKRLGVDQVKIFMSWAAMAPDPQSHTRPHFDAASPAAYSPAFWAGFDAIVRGAASRGLGVDLALVGPAPLWATAPGVPPGTGHELPRHVGALAEEFGAFVHAVAERYSGHYKPAGAPSRLAEGRLLVDLERAELRPNSSRRRRWTARPWRSRPRSIAACSTPPGVRSAQTGHGHDTILIGEVAPRGQTVGDQPGNFSGMVPLRFIRALYCVDSSLHPLTGAAATARSCPSTSAGSAGSRASIPGCSRPAGSPSTPTRRDSRRTSARPDEPDYADLPQLESSSTRSTARWRRTARTRSCRCTTPSSAIRPIRRRRYRARGPPWPRRRRGPTWPST